MSEEYYNNQTKERFLEEREKSYVDIRKIMRPYFNITKYYEEKFDRDCSAFTTREILNMYASMGTRSWERLLNMNSQLKYYASWSIREGLVPDNQNHYEELDKNDMYSCLNIGFKNQLVITREELERNLDKFINISDAFLALAVFEGIDGPNHSDFFDLTPDKFIEGKVNLPNNRILTVSKRLTALAIESAEEYMFYRADGKERKYKQDDPRIIKDVNNSSESDSLDKNQQKIYRKLVRIANEYGKAYSFVGLKNSGRLDMLQRLMKEDGSNNPRETYDKHVNEFNKRYGELQRIYRWVDEYKPYLENSGE